MIREPEDTIANYRDLKVWQKAMDLVEKVYQLTNDMPESEKFGLTSQIRRASVSIPSNIAEGYGRANRGDYRRHLMIANGSLKELETQLILLNRLKYVTQLQSKPIWKLSQEVGKMLYKMINTLNN